MKLSRLTGGGCCRPRDVRTQTTALLVVVLFGICSGGWRVRETAHMSRGQDANTGYIVPFRSCADTFPLLAFSGLIPGTWLGLHFYQYAPMNRYALVKVDTGDLSVHGGLIPGNLLPWATGDLDGDSRPELVGHSINGSTQDNLITSYIPPAGSGVPDSLKTSVRYYGPAADAQRFYLTDLDQDGKKEVAFRGWISHEITVYEWTGDSLRQTISLPCDNGYNLAIGDFDGDSLIEVATTGLGSNNWIMVYKCTGNNVLLPWDSTPIARINGDDIFTASNLDGYHRAVIFASYFIVGGYAYLYEVEPTNMTHDYQPILIDSTPDGGEIYAHSVCGDIDGDGLDEVLWSVGNQIRAYRHTGPHQYDLVWNWWNGGNNSCNLNLHDMNGNGYNEILESGAGQTHIFEIEAIRVLNPNTSIILHPGDTCRIRWETFTPPRCDSVSLFLRTDTSWTLDTLIHGLPPSDTAWIWTVPDIRSDYCHVVAITYGPGWQYDESDTFFHILPLGVEESAAPLVKETRLLGAFPNPLAAATRVQFQLREQNRVKLSVCDVSGRTVAILADGIVKPGVYSRYWAVAPTVPNGIYFIHLEAPDCRETQKVILTR